MNIWNASSGSNVSIESPSRATHKCITRRQWVNRKEPPAMLNRHYRKGCRVFQNSKFLSCIVAFYSPMLHAKRNSYAKFQQNSEGDHHLLLGFFSPFLAATKQLYEWFSPPVCPSHFFTPQPFGLEGYCRHGSGGRAGGCQTCGTHISVTTWLIFSIRSSMELSRPVVVHCHGNLPICPIWACPWAKNLSNLPQIGSRLCGTHISETAGWIYPI